ncbi:MAG: hypothetical protein EOM40_09480 [Clostridia bacterium]|nr:hypothetical protein [Clostridia bacterium]NCC42394.1 hypothetical protein [Clostridia bacterium]
MRKMKKLLVSLLSICVLFSLSAVSALAASEPYFYTVTLYSGNMGTIAGADDSDRTIKTITKDATYGVPVTINLNDVTVRDSKYYVKGIRFSGRDNSELLSRTSVNVYGDTDLVVAYGVMANRVTYTVNYQDANGNEVAPSETLYGDVGDKPVVAYAYIENFVPQALALTKTLSSNEAENVFTFVYTPGDSGAIITNETTEVLPGTTNITTVPGTTTTTPADGTAATPADGTAAAGTTTPEDAAAAAGNDAATGAGPGNADAAAGDGTDAAADGETVAIPDEETPQGVVDLDEGETPTTNKDLDGSTSKAPLVAGIAIGVAALVALGGLVIFLKKRAS